MTLAQLVRHHANNAREYLGGGILGGDVMNDRKPVAGQVWVKSKHRPPNESKSHAAILRRVPAGLAPVSMWLPMNLAQIFVRSGKSGNTATRSKSRMPAKNP